MFDDFNAQAPMLFLVLLQPCFERSNYGCDEAQPSRLFGPLAPKQPMLTFLPHLRQVLSDSSPQMLPKTFAPLPDKSGLI